jgi:hypothetical protein
MINNQYAPVMTPLEAAADDILNVVRCKRKVGS